MAIIAREGSSVCFSQDSNSSVLSRIHTNWQQRKIQILLSAGLSFLLTGVLVYSSLPFVATSGIVAMCCIAFLGRFLLGKPTQPRFIQVPKFWHTTTPIIIGIGVVTSSTFRIGALTSLIDLFIHYQVLSPIIDKIYPKIKPKNATPPYERMSDEVYREYHEYLWYSCCVRDPILEELLFRGLIHPFLCSKLGPVIGTILDSFIFGYNHQYYHITKNSQMKQCISAAFGGLIFGYLKIRYGLLASIASHMVYNTFIQINATKELNKEFEEWCQMKNYRVSYTIVPSFPEILPQRSRDRK